MTVGDRVGYSDFFLSLLKPPAKNKQLKPADQRGHIRRVDRNLVTVHWDDGRISHHHKKNISIRK